MSGPSCLPSSPTPLPPSSSFNSPMLSLPLLLPSLIFLPFLLSTFLLSSTFSCPPPPFLIPAPKGEALPTCVTGPGPWSLLASSEQLFKNTDAGPAQSLLWGTGTVIH